MRNILILAVILVGCSKSKDRNESPPAPPPKPVAADQPAIDPACADQASKLETWLKDLASEGHAEPVPRDVNLVKLAAEAPKEIVPAPSVMVGHEAVAFQGQMFGGTKRPDTYASLRDKMKAASKGPNVLFLVDDKTPWSALVALVGAAAAADHPRVTFGFAAGASRVSAPPTSSVDAKLDELAKPADPSGKAEPLASGVQTGGFVGEMFKDCSAVTTLFQKLGKMDVARDPVIVKELPAAIAACGCKAEIPAVQRLMWSWWGRDSRTPMVGVTVEVAKVAKDGVAVTAKANAPWAETHKLVLDASKQGKPVTLQ